MENLQQARLHDYIVTNSNKTYTVLHIFDRTPQSLILEEITAPTSAFGAAAETSVDWKAWIAAGAPGNSSWVMYEIDTETARIIDYFSFTRNGWLDVGASESFLTTLLNLPLEKVPLDKRQRMGRPGDQERPLWQPKMTVDGRVVRNAQFNAFETKWPLDDSKLSGRIITLYIPHERDLYPSYFPYWVDVDSNVPGARIRVIDSGAGLQSPKLEMPRMHPEIIAKGQGRDDSLSLTVRARTSYQKVRLFALDDDADFDGPSKISLSFTTQETKHPEEIILSVSAQVLQARLKPDHPYRFQIVPIDREELSFETQDPWHWKKGR